MPEYTCYNCGRTVLLLDPPSKIRICPHCGRRLHVCENCQFDDVSGCALGGDRVFSATHGERCDRFQYRASAAHAV